MALRCHLKLALFLAACSAGAMHIANTDVFLSSLDALRLDGRLTFHDVADAAKDFGHRFSFPPYAVLHPASVSDIAASLKHASHSGRRLTVAARGRGHSLHGQAQAENGLVIRMESLAGAISVHAAGDAPYVDASGGELWINVLNETLKHGLSPKSWTDYLHLTIGGTLSNAGVSGQTFRHGPQISNVLQLEVVTGRGDVVTCSPEASPDLFFAVLGGLGQFGIITRARIALEPAPAMVRWIRVLYSDFATFTADQEMLIAADSTFDYIEGFVIINRTGILNYWRTSFKPQDPKVRHSGELDSAGRVLFCLEITKYFNPGDAAGMEKEVERLLSRLRYIPATLFFSDVSYLQFLERVHTSELNLRAKGLWEIPHPWLNLLIPRSRIQEFAAEVFGSILTDSNNGPILLYPVNRSKWSNKTSMVIPDEEVFYLLGLLPSALGTGEHDSLQRALEKNEMIMKYCRAANIKQYLPHYATQEEWKKHFGDRWDAFARRKRAYDPLAILAPGLRIFQKPLQPSPLQSSS